MSSISLNITASPDLVEALKNLALALNGQTALIPSKMNAEEESEEVTEEAEEVAETPLKTPIEPFVQQAPTAVVNDPKPKAKVPTTRDVKDAVQKTVNLIKDKGRNPQDILGKELFKGKYGIVSTDDLPEERRAEFIADLREIYKAVKDAN